MDKEKLKQLTHEQKWSIIFKNYGEYPQINKAGKYPNYIDESNALMDLILSGEVNKNNESK